MVQIDFKLAESGKLVTSTTQRFVGHMPTDLDQAVPSLGKLRVIRGASSASNVYEVDDKRDLHVFVIGRGPEPLLYTFRPGKRGHAESYTVNIDLDLDN